MAQERNIRIANASIRDRNAQGPLLDYARLLEYHRLLYCSAIIGIYPSIELMCSFKVSAVAEALACQ